METKTETETHSDKDCLSDGLTDRLTSNKFIARPFPFQNGNPVQGREKRQANERIDEMNIRHRIQTNIANDGLTFANALFIRLQVGQVD